MYNFYRAHRLAISLLIAFIVSLFACDVYLLAWVIEMWWEAR